MKYFQSTTDASYMYRPTTASDSSQYNGTAAKGNLADQMKTVFVVRTVYTADADLTLSQVRVE